MKSVRTTRPRWRQRRCSSRRLRCSRASYRHVRVRESILRWRCGPMAEGEATSRTLSWSGTFLYTRLFPVVWIGGFGFGTLQLLLYPESTLYNGVRGAAPPGVRWLLLAAWIVGTTLILI